MKINIELTWDEVRTITSALEENTDTRREDNSFLSRQCQSEAEIKRLNLTAIKANKALINKLEKALEK